MPPHEPVRPHAQGLSHHETHAPDPRQRATKADEPTAERCTTIPGCVLQETTNGASGVNR